MAPINMTIVRRKSEKCLRAATNTTGDIESGVSLMNEPKMADV